MLLFLRDGTTGVTAWKGAAYIGFFGPDTGGNTGRFGGCDHREYLSFLSPEKGRFASPSRVAKRATTSWLFVTFGEHGMGLLPATLGIGSKWTC